MTTCISILRGINVSGRNLIKMEALKKAYESLGFQDVTTYVQSGNVIFRCPDKGTNEVEKSISAKIKTEFGFDVPVIVLTICKLERIIDQNPFTGDPGKDPSFFHVTFLASKPGEFKHDEITGKAAGNEAISFSDDCVYLCCPNGYGNTKLSNNFLESKLKVGATTRNWKTTQELLKIAFKVSTK